MGIFLHAFIAAVAVFLVSCENPKKPEPNSLQYNSPIDSLTKKPGRNDSTDTQMRENSHLNYRLSLPRLHPESLSVSLEIKKQANVNELVLPLVYFDNPLDSLSGSLVKDLKLYDSSGRMLDTISSTVMVGPRPSIVMTIPENATYPVTVRYRVNFGVINYNTDRFDLPDMHIDENSALMMGAYLFAVPFAHTLPQMWRTQRLISLHVNIPDSLDPLGIPSNNLTYKNVYELLFIQIAVGGLVVGQGRGGNQDFSLHLLDAADTRNYDWQPIVDQCVAALDKIVPLFGKFTEGTSYHIYFYPMGGGIEGTHSFISLPPTSDVLSFLPVLIAHEFYHHTIGIRCGEYDDPWWKEGTAEYLGWVTAAQCGYADSQDLYNNFVVRYVSSEKIDDYPPASQTFRPLIFSESLYDVAYGKGAQINMLLDLAVREGTGNSLNIADVTAQLVKRYYNSAFTRDQMISLYFEVAGVDIEPILSDYADTAGKIPRDVLDDAFGKLKDMHAFDIETSTGVLSKAKGRRNIDRPSPEPFFHY